jgi:hypothetical protein
MHKYTQAYIGTHIRVHTYVGPNALSNMFLVRSDCNAKGEKWKNPSLSLFYPCTEDKLQFTQ